MSCKTCKSDRIVGITAKCSDMCSMNYEGRSQSYYVPSNIGIGNHEDYVEMDYCLECGQIQADFPYPDPVFRNEDEED